jgi:hypothetical protein
VIDGGVVGTGFFWGFSIDFAGVGGLLTLVVLVVLVVFTVVGWVALAFLADFEVDFEESFLAFSIEFLLNFDSFWLDSSDTLRVLFAQSASLSGSMISKYSSNISILSEFLLGPLIDFGGTVEVFNFLPEESILVNPLMLRVDWNPLSPTHTTSSFTIHPCVPTKNAPGLHPNRWNWSPDFGIINHWHTSVELTQLATKLTEQAEVRHAPSGDTPDCTLIVGGIRVVVGSTGGNSWMSAGVVLEVTPAVGVTGIMVGFGDSVDGFTVTNTVELGVVTGAMGIKASLRI